MLAELVEVDLLGLTEGLHFLVGHRCLFQLGEGLRVGLDVFRFDQPGGLPPEAVVAEQAHLGV